MPPKRGKKRKVTTDLSGRADATDGNDALSPPDRKNWPGWVEMESDPAFFNVMLKEMGIRGVRVQDIFSLEDGDLALLPQPVHALIFLFKYKQGDDEGTGTECPDHVWFANQIPDFACGTVALLNIVNNIPGLIMGEELCAFKEFTKEMDPLARGDALDGFDFVRKIHNSFARENDILNADVIMRDKMNGLKRKRSQAKAKETREAKKIKQMPLQEKPANVTSAPIRSSGRTTSTEKQKDPGPEKLTKTGTPEHLSSPIAGPPESDGDFKTPTKGSKARVIDTSSQAQRRSTRPPKPRKDVFAESATVVAEEENEGGFHFIAYMPIQGHVWKLDGVDSFPQDIGTFDGPNGGDWLNVAEPVLRTRMALHEAGGIEFNLMALVRDPLDGHREELMQNVKALQEVERKLDRIVEDWRALHGTETPKDVVTTSSVDLNVSAADIATAKIPPPMKDDLEQEEDLVELVDLRKKIIEAQAPLRGAVRDAQLASQNDENEARHRRHDYGSFVKGWLNALAENELFNDLLSDS